MLLALLTLKPVEIRLPFERAIEAASLEQELAEDGVEVLTVG